MSKRIYTPEEITEIAGNVASIIEETGSLVDAMDELTSNGAPEVSLTTMSAGLTLLSLIPNSTNSLPITAPIAKNRPSSCCWCYRSRGGR